MICAKEDPKFETAWGFPLSRSSVMYLMSKNAVLARIDFDKMIFEIYRQDLLPFAIRGKGVNLFSVYNWLSQRVLSLSRSNAKRILDSLQLDQNNRMAIWFSCRGLSLTDCYWLKSEDDSTTWEMVNLYNNSLSEAVARVALTGEFVSIQGHINTPELTNAGSYAKCWRRGKDGIYLYKTGSMQGNNKKYLVDILCSDLLDRTDVNHVVYTKGQSGLRPVSRCLNMTNEQLSICGMGYYAGYCTRNSIDLQSYLLSCKDYYDMLIVDYLINNTDRHSGNWGIYFNANTGEALRLHPLFDHNLSLDLKGSTESKVILGKSLEECAYFAKSRSPLDVTRLQEYAKTVTVRKRFIEIFGGEIEYKEFLRRLRTYSSWRYCDDSIR